MEHALKNNNTARAPLFNCTYLLFIFNLIEISFLVGMPMAKKYKISYPHYAQYVGNKLISKMRWLEIKKK